MKFVMLAMNNEKQAQIQGVVFICGIPHAGIMGRCLPSSRDPALNLGGFCLMVGWDWNSRMW